MEQHDSSESFRDFTALRCQKQSRAEPAAVGQSSSGWRARLLTPQGFERFSFQLFPGLPSHRTN